MRYLTLCLLLLGASSLGAMEAWRWTDKDGVVHYSDQPMPGAEKVQLNAAPKPGSVAPPTSRPQDSEDSARNPPFRYTSCTVASPAQDEVFESVDSVGVSLQVLPGLRPGDRVEVRLNGQVVTDWPPSSTGYQLSGLARGNYQLSGRVLDADGHTMCTLTGSSFNVHQPSLLTPGRPPPPRS